MEVIHQKIPGVILLGDRNRVCEAGLLDVLQSLSPDVADALPGGTPDPVGLPTNETSEEIQSGRFGNRPPVGRVSAQVARAIHTSMSSYTRVLGVDFSEEPFTDELLRRDDINFAISFGGDGTVLRATRRLQAFAIPLLAVNLGHLGFLADVTPEELAETLSVLAWGVTTRLQSHLMLRCRVLRKRASEPISVATNRSDVASEVAVREIAGEEDVGEEAENIPEVFALNEVAVQTGATFRQIVLKLAIDGETVACYDGDGLILATPIGSTAHALSAGGPIMRHTLETVLICPLNPHTLTMRSVVDSASRRYVISVIQADPGTSVVVDGSVLTQVAPGDRIEITRSEWSFRTVMPPRHSYYRTLREKLGWGGRMVPRKDDPKG